MTRSFLDAGRLPAWFNNSGPDSDVVISSRIRLARNLVHRTFPYHASADERKLVYNEVTGILSNETKLPHFEVVDFCKLEKLQQQFFVEKRVASPDLMNMEGQRGVALDPTQRINIMINEEDHLRIQGLDSGYQPEILWETLNKIDDTLGRKLRFAFDLRRGFLTCCPTNSGTGLRISFLMHLPDWYLPKPLMRFYRVPARWVSRPVAFLVSTQRWWVIFSSFPTRQPWGPMSVNFSVLLRKLSVRSLNMSGKLGSACAAKLAWRLLIRFTGLMEFSCMPELSVWQSV